MKSSLNKDANFEKGDTEVYQIKELLEFPELVHGFSTKSFGNMSVPDNNKDKVLENRKEFLKALDIKEFKIPYIAQVHSDKIKILDKSNVDEFSEVDGLITKKTGIALMIIVADCYPILFYEPTRNVVGIAHVGWRGAKANMPSKMVKLLKEKFDIKPLDIFVGVGPGICPRCYKFKDPVQKNFSEWQKYLKKDKNGYYEIDFLSFALDDLVNEGLNREKIFLSNVCTKENPAYFYSHVLAKEKGRVEKEGRFAAIIGLRD